MISYIYFTFEYGILFIAIYLIVHVIEIKTAFHNDTTELREKIVDLNQEINKLKMKPDEKCS
jgi:hypothetical protein